MKKLITVLVLFTLVTVGVFAQIKYSAGGGVFFNGNFGNGVEAKLYGDFDVLQEFNNTTYGIYGFFDATYIEASIAVGFGSFNYEYWLSDLTYSEKANGTITIADITLLGKYPFELGSVTVFPLIGLSYTTIISIDYFSEPSDLNQIGFLFGGGLDFNLNKTLFLRVSALFQIRLNSKFQDDQADSLKEVGFDKTDTSWGMGPVIKLGIGYRL